MSAYYEAEELSSYLDTIVASVGAIFRHHSVGTRLTVAVVKKAIMEQQTVTGGLEIDNNVDLAMQTFCSWQQDFQVSHSLKADVAVLITRNEMCRQKGSMTTEVCNTLGLAQLGSMCDPVRSCLLAQDNGLMLATTIAHELAHTMGVEHDDEHSNGVMAPVLRNSVKELTWSNKSKDQLNKFLSSKSGLCLSSVQRHNFSSAAWLKVPAGAAYNAEEQCRLVHGQGNVSVCTSPPDNVQFCALLWCQDEETCFSSGDPPAAGTICGTHRWCISGECVRMEESIDPVAGGWGQWSPWSACSRSCGGGITASRRKCDSPTPQKGGHFCDGSAVRHSICNIRPCPVDSMQHRTRQCYEETGREDARVEVNYNPCFLICTASSGGLAVKFRAEDGTRCGKEIPGLCVGGRCVSVGCDWIIGSTMVLDSCGVCGGNGSMCSEVWGEWSDSGTDSDYIEIVSFPIFARNIEVWEFGSRDNYLAMVGDSSGQGYINWDRKIQQPGTYLVNGGINLEYLRGENQQQVYIKEQLKEPVIAFLFRFSPGSRISWNYTIPFRNTTYQETYSWSMSDWSVCNATCGGGVQNSIPRCIKNSDPGSLFDPFTCDIKDKPQDLTRACGTAACPPTWWTGLWQKCEDACQGVRHRTVLCSNTQNQALIDSTCSANPRPASVDSCFQSQECREEGENSKKENPHTEIGIIQPGYLMQSMVTNIVDEIRDEEDIMEIDFSNIVLQDWNDRNVDGGNWMIGNWSSCSMPCGPGISYRSVTCPGNCTLDLKPPTMAICNIRPCSDWTVGTWSECDVLCGEGIQTRSVTCSGLCDSGTRPEHRMTCIEGDCSLWTVGPWSSCNTKCGLGSRVRAVSCIHAITEVPTGYCSEQERPVVQEECRTKCPRREKDVTEISVRRCIDVMDSSTCQKYSTYCGVRISFTKRCCRTCFKQFKLRQKELV